MANGLEQKLAALEAAAASVRREIANGPCLGFGHDWVFAGSSNLGCHADCACGGPVYSCSKCGDCDYGDNSEADELRAECAADHPKGVEPWA